MPEIYDNRQNITGLIEPDSIQTITNQNADGKLDAEIISYSNETKETVTGI